MSGRCESGAAASSLVPRRQLIIWGVSPLAEVLGYYFSNDTRYEVVAFVGGCCPSGADSALERPLLAMDEVVERFPPGRWDMFIAWGSHGPDDWRSSIDDARSRGYSLPNYISSRALVWPDLEIGENNALMPNVHVEPSVRIGGGNIFCSDTLVGHGVSIGDYNYFGPKCLLGGRSVIESGCELASGTVLINDIRVRFGTNTLTGTTIYRDTHAHSRYVGSPARRCLAKRERDVASD